MGHVSKGSLEKQVANGRYGACRAWVSVDWAQGASVVFRSLPGCRLHWHLLELQPRPVLVNRRATSSSNAAPFRKPALCDGFLRLLCGRI